MGELIKIVKDALETEELSLEEIEIIPDIDSTLEADYDFLDDNKAFFESVN